MVAPDFEPSRRTIEDLLGGQRYYEIPRFQRPYSWDKANWDEFWRDVFHDNEEGYFIGPMVGFRQEASAGPVAVVDGQQRLTTITILIAVLRNHFSEIGEQELARGVHRFIERPDRDNQDKFVLQPQKLSHYLNDGILQYPNDATLKPMEPGDWDLSKAYTDMQQRVKSELSTAGPLESKTSKVARLKSMRDRLLSLKVIWVEHRNEDDAYIVFETLNSRGKDLETVDLLKNLTLSKIRTGNKSADRALRKWDTFRSTLQTSNPPISADQFLLHWWRSREPYIGQKKLYQDMKKQIRNKENAGTRLDQLVSDAKLYRNVMEPSSRQWGPEEARMRQSLEALITFKVIQPAPLFLALLRCREERTLRARPIIKAMRAIENFHFQATAVAGLSSSGGISERYAKYARELTLATTAADRKGKIDDFCGVMAGSLPDEDLFVAGFSELQYTETITNDKKLVRYILSTFHAAATQHDWRSATIEHLMPQSLGDAVSQKVVGKLGNLLWIDEATNAKLGNADFPRKKAILESKRGTMDIDDILDCSEWGIKEINERTERMARKAIEEVWKFES